MTGARRRASLAWDARYRLDPDASWSTCRLLDVTLTDAEIELSDSLPIDRVEDQPFFLQIDTIAEDQVDLTMRAVVRDVSLDDTGMPVARVEFDARREERLLLQLLVRLHTLV